jgi:hypothetical protein
VLFLFDDYQKQNKKQQHRRPSNQSFWGTQVFDNIRRNSSSGGGRMRCVAAADADATVGFIDTVVVIDVVDVIDVLNIAAVVVFVTVDSDANIGFIDAVVDVIDVVVAKHEHLQFFVGLQYGAFFIVFSLSLSRQKV